MATQQEQQRGSNWQGREISALINIWGDEEYRHANDDPFTKKKKIMERILTRLGELGYNRSVTQITNKLKQLKTKYKQVLDANIEAKTETRSNKLSFTGAILVL